MKSFRPMLAGKVDLEKLSYPVLASPKLDGVRCVVTKGRALTRSLKEVPNLYVAMELSSERLDGLDGELIVGPPTSTSVFRTTSSAVMSIEGTPKFTYHVFDDSSKPDEAFEKRLDRARLKIHRLGSKEVRLVEHVLLAWPEDLERYERKMLALGYEGVMLRDPAGPYKYGRSTTNEGWLLKLKRLEDSEAEVLGAVPLMSNTNPAKRNELGLLERSSARSGLRPKPLLGALWVKDIKTKVEFEIGTGFTEDDRRSIWRRRHTIVGSIVKYTYQAVGVKDKPRIPVFAGFRSKEDM